MKSSITLFAPFILVIIACNPCNRFFEYKANTLNVKGITTKLKEAGSEVVDLGVGEISIKPEFVKASQRLQELDLLQFSICGQMKSLSKNSPERDKLVAENLATYREMLKIAQAAVDVPESKNESNINTGVNYGIIGNNNQIKLNTAPPQRSLDDKSMEQLIVLVNQELSKKPKIKDGCIQILSVGGDSEAYNLANEMLNFLKNKNLNVRNDIGQFNRAPAIKGIQVGSRMDENCLSIYVGYK
jgi:hypothetical protein